MSASTTSSASCLWLWPISSASEDGKENSQKPSYVTFTQYYKLTQFWFVVFFFFLFPWMWYDSMETTLRETGGTFRILGFQKGDTAQRVWEQCTCWRDKASSKPRAEETWRLGIVRERRNKTKQNARQTNPPKNTKPQPCILSDHCNHGSSGPNQSRAST